MSHTQKFSELTPLAQAVAADDYIHIVDKSDTTQSPEGSSKRVDISALKTMILAEVNVEVANNAANIAANAVLIADNALAISGNDTDIAANAANIAANALAISSNDTDIAANALAIANNDTDIAANATAIATNAANIAANGGDITANALAIAANATSIAANAILISDNTSDIAANAVLIAANTLAAGNNASDIATETARATAAELANAAAITAEETRATAAETALDAKIVEIAQWSVNGNLQSGAYLRNGQERGAPDRGQPFDRVYSVEVLTWAIADNQKAGTFYFQNGTDGTLIGSIAISSAADGKVESGTDFTAFNLPALKKVGVYWIPDGGGNAIANVVLNVTLKEV